MATQTCPVCGQQGTVKLDKKQRPFFRCESCQTVIFTYSELGADALQSGTWPFAGGKEPEPSKPKPGPVVEIPEFVRELQRLGREVRALKDTMKGPRTGLALIREKQKSLST